MAAAPETCDLAELAELFGVTEKAVRDWIEDGLPVVVRGKQGRGKKTKVALRDAVRWYFRINAEALELDRQRSRLAREQADRAAIDNAERRGELLIAENIGALLERAFGVFRQKLLGAPTKLAAIVSPENPKLARDIIAAEMDEILTELANHFERARQKQRGGAARGKGRRAAASAKANGH